MNIKMLFTLLMIFASINSISGQLLEICNKKPGYTFAQRDWKISLASDGQYPFVVSIKFRRRSDDLTDHCQWCSGLIVGKRHVLVTECGSSRTSYGMGPGFAGLHPYQFVVHAGSVNLENSTTALGVRKSVDVDKTKIIGQFPYQYYEENHFRILELKHPLKFGKNLGCIRLSQLAFKLPPVTELTMLQWCFHDQSGDPHDYRRYTLHSIVVKRDCEKSGHEEELALKGPHWLRQSCILADGKRPSVNMEYPCQRTASNVFIYNDTYYGFLVDVRHLRYDYIFHYPLRYWIFSEYQYTYKYINILKEIIGEEACDLPED